MVATFNPAVKHFLPMREKKNNVMKRGTERGKRTGQKGRK
jgi:hypothetical protein